MTKVGLILCDYFTENLARLVNASSINMIKNKGVEPPELPEFFSVVVGGSGVGIGSGSGIGSMVPPSSNTTLNSSSSKSSFMTLTPR